MHYYPDNAPSARRIIKNCVPFELVDKLTVFDRDNWTCLYCGQRVKLVGDTPTDNNYVKGTLEHIVPISLGGSHTYSNVATSCYDCNIQKNNNADLVDIGHLLNLLSGPQAMTYTDRRTNELMTKADTVISQPEPRFICPFCGDSRRSRPGMQAHIVAYHETTLEALVK